MKIGTAPFAALLGVVALPFLLVNGSYALIEIALPNRVSVASWEMASSVVFVANIALVIWAIRRVPMDGFARGALGFVLVVLMFYSALIMQSHWNCGEPRYTYIGETPSATAAQAVFCKSDSAI